MRKTPRISIITPTFNRRDALARAIASVQAQTIGDYEHLIVDDNSQDETEALVREVGDERIRYVRFSHWQGANAARNRGLELARASLVTFLDSDDEYLPDRLESTLKRWAVQPRLPLLISSFTTKKDGRDCPSVNPEVWLAGSELELALMTYGIAIAGTSITVRREHLRQIGGFDPCIRRLQDREVLLRLSQIGGAQLSSQIDWTKHRSEDSISRPRRGYVESLGAMMARHPDVARKYRSLLCYHVARHMLADFTHGRLSQAMESHRANRAACELQFTLWQMVRGFRKSYRERHEFISSFRDRAPRLTIWSPPTDEAAASSNSTNELISLPLRSLRAA